MTLGSWSEPISVLGACLYLIEAGLLFVAFRWLFRALRVPAAWRNALYAIAVFPGFIGAVSETSAWSGPLPAVLGVPTYFFAVDGWTLGWTPVPLISVAIMGSVPFGEAAGLYVYEGLALLAWLTICTLLWRARRKRAKR